MDRLALTTIAERLVSPLNRLLDADRHEHVLDERSHRPWPLPRAPWFMGQTWERLLFAHWTVPVEDLRRVVPPQVPLDLYEGQAWVGVTPFRVSRLRLRGTAPLPRASTFPELNVRTYVSLGGKPGIWFLSLDAGSRLAVSAARRFYRLPYFAARARIDWAGEEVAYSSRRTSGDGPPAAFEGAYRAVGDSYVAPPGSLDHFLTERYCLYTLDHRRRVLRADIHHPPWPLQRAQAEIRLNTMAAPLDLPLQGDPLLHLAARQDVAIWRLQEVRDASA